MVKPGTLLEELRIRRMEEEKLQLKNAENIFWVDGYLSPLVVCRLPSSTWNTVRMG